MGWWLGWGGGWAPRTGHGSVVNNIGDPFSWDPKDRVVLFPFQMTTLSWLIFNGGVILTNHLHYLDGSPSTKWLTMGWRVGISSKWPENWLANLSFPEKPTAIVHLKK